MYSELAIVEAHYPCKERRRPVYRSAGDVHDPRISAISVPAVDSIELAVLIGRLLVLGGVAHLSISISGGGASRVISQVILGMVYVIGGTFFWPHPLLQLGHSCAALCPVISTIKATLNVFK